MKVDVLNLENVNVGALEIADDIFGLVPRMDIIKRVVDWQRAKSMAGTHQTKTVSQVAGTTKKPFKQKGTGNARQGSLRSVHMRGGGVSHGPVTRSHETKLNKKIRKLGLKHALSHKLQNGDLFIVDISGVAVPKTNVLDKMLKNYHKKSFLIIDGDTVGTNVAVVAKNIPNVGVLPQIGANVYDVLKYDCVLLSKSCLTLLEQRLRY